MSDSRAVAIARAHLEAWTNHDLDTVHDNLAEDVQFFSPAANLVGIDEYMNAPRGLTQFARQVVPGSLRVIAAMGEFTGQYCDLMPGVDLASLPYWDLYAALRPSRQMDSWGLPEAQLEKFRAAHRTLVAAALTRLEAE